MVWHSTLLCLCGLAFASALNPGVKIQANQRAMDYMKGVGLQVMNKELKGMHLPDISGQPALLRRNRPGMSPDIFHYWLTSVVLVGFNAPASQASVTMSPPKSLAARVGGITANIHANYKIRVGEGWFSITKTGTVTASASSTSFTQGLSLLQRGGKPQVSAGSCSANIGHLDISFHGDLIDDIINLFKSFIEDYVKDQINSVLCSEVKTLIDSEANKILSGIPTSISVYDGFNIDYSLTSDPVVESRQDAMVPMLGRVWYTGHHHDPNMPQAAPMSSVVNSNKMLCIKADAEEVIGSLGYSTQISGLLHYTLNKQTLQEFGMSKFLDCSCPGSQCLGAFLPQIQALCGPGGTAEVVMTSTQAPAATVNTTGGYLSFGGDLDFKAIQKSGNVVELFTAHVSLSAWIPGNVSFVGWKLKGSIVITGATLTLKSSAVQGLSQAMLNGIWQLVVVGAVQGELNKVAGNGIQLPNIPDVTIQSPVVFFGQRTITVCADIKYTGPTQ